ncbi:MAG TPA: class I SAM-dependent rRNA methyltransferase [Longimicrobiales bacterium]|nr:class I SAM-dependent rRNA methyltransferase [Longimicrobiales bacterium]
MNDIARVSRRGAQRWFHGHPWIYRSDVLEAPSVPAGAVHVVDERGDFLGTALWSPTSQISLRMLTDDDQPIDQVFWRDRIAAAVAYRQSLNIDANAYRVLHGEADGTPSLVVDKYDDCLVTQFLSAGLEAYRDEIVGALIELLQPAGILARNDPAVRVHEQLPQETVLLHGAVPEEIEVQEGSVRYLAAPWHGQKTGAFLDQRENRARVGELARGRTMDCFSFHGSFAMHLARNSTAVTAIDSSADALSRAQVNADLNGFANIGFVEANAFDYLREQEEAGEAYDVVVVDPPAFAKRRDAVPKALRGYKEINLRAMRLLKPGGYLCSFSCSFHISTSLFREMLEQAAADAGRPMRWIEARGQATDHPEIVQIPESIYLKGAILQAAS